MKAQTFFVLLAFMTTTVGVPAIAHAPRPPLFLSRDSAPTFTRNQLRALLALQVRSSRQTATLALIRTLSHRKFIFEPKFSSKLAAVKKEKPLDESPLLKAKTVLQKDIALDDSDELANRIRYIKDEEDTIIVGDRDIIKIDLGEVAHSVIPIHTIAP